MESHNQREEDPSGMGQRQPTRWERSLLVWMVAVSLPLIGLAACERSGLVRTMARDSAVPAIPGDSNGETREADAEVFFPAPAQLNDSAVPVAPHARDVGDASMPVTADVGDVGAQVISDATDTSHCGEIPVSCDDDNACTNNVRQGSVCVHSAAPDGTPCDDDDVCTQNDRCLAGFCVGGARVTGKPELLSSSTPSLLGQGLGVGANRFLFWGPCAKAGQPLTLVRSESGRLDRIDHLLFSGCIKNVYSVGDDLVAYATNADSRPLTHGGGLLDLSGDKLTMRGTFTVDVAVQPRHFAVTKDRLWVCLQSYYVGVATDLLQIDRSNPDSLRQIGDPIVVNGYCGTLAAASDGQNVYVATNKDTLVLAPGAGSVTFEPSLGLPSSSVHVGYGFITLASSDTVKVLRESDRTQVASLAVEKGANARVTHRGLEVETVSSTSGEISYSIYRLGVGASQPLALLGVQKVGQVVDTGLVGGFFGSGTGVWASHENALIVGSSIFHLGDSPPFLSQIDDPNLSWPAYLRAEGTSIFLRDQNRAIHIDASDPAQPKAVAGGMYSAPRTMTLEVPASGQVGLYGCTTLPPRDPEYVRDVSPSGCRDGNALRLRAFDANQQPIERASHVLPTTGSISLGATHRHIYKISIDRQSPGRAHRLQRWPAEWFERTSLQAPDIDRTISVPGGQIEQVARIHDDKALAFTAKPTVPVSLATDLYWTTLSAGGEVVGPLRLDLQVLDLAVHGDRVLVMGYKPNRTGSFDLEFVAVERRKDSLVETGRTGWAVADGGDWEADYASLFFEIYHNQALAFDGRVAYLQLAQGTPATPSPAVVGFRFEDLPSTPIAYPIESNQDLWDFIESDIGLVFSTPSRLYIARPYCPPS